MGVGMGMLSVLSVMRNRRKAFHIFHTSCLVHWILFRESEIWKNQPLSIDMDGEIMKPKPKVSSAFCPQCQGTGSVTEEDQLEIPRFLPQSEVCTLRSAEQVKGRTSHYLHSSNKQQVCFFRNFMIDEKVQREIINHRSLSHPNIVRFKEVLLTPTHLAIVMEYAAGVELFERVCTAGKFSEDEVYTMGIEDYNFEIFG